MADASRAKGANDVSLTLAASASAFEVRQIGSGQAAVMKGANAATSGDSRSFETAGQYVVTKATGVVLLDGGRVYWDHSANNATFRKVNDRDFYLGRCVGDAASADTTCTVNLNVDPPYDIDIANDACLSVLVGTPAAGGFGYPVRRGGCWVLELTATSEAQKVDLLSRDGFDLAANAIVEFAFLIENDGSNATQDFTIGVASGTHASDFQSVTSFVAVSTVGNSTNINVQSDDNSTDVAPTDSTLDYTEGTAVGQRVEGWLDFRNPADVQVYVNGALVLGSTVFTAGSSGTHYLIAHLEKTSSTDVYKVAVDWLRCRLMEQ
jgi:predicted RecA/RadA family phage recombinase